MRAIFMGTPEFAVPSLLGLAGVPGIELVGVVTRIDQPTGRGKTLTPPPVKVAASVHGWHVLQPGSLRRAPAQAVLAELSPELIVVAAFGQILPQSVLDMPRYGCLNVHASLLPKYRGASPIAAAILAGEAETGNTIMLMEAGLDTGPILTQARLPISADDTTATLTERLAVQGADLLARTIPEWLSGALHPTAQDETQATSTRLIRKEDSAIDWLQPAEVISRQVRAYTPWPGTVTLWRGQMLKVVAAHVAMDGPVAKPGTVVTWGRAMVGIACGEGTMLALDMIQLPGKRALPAMDVVRGHPSLVGAVLPTAQEDHA